MNIETVQNLFDQCKYKDALKLSGKILRDSSLKKSMSARTLRFQQLLHLESLKKIKPAEFDQNLEQDVLLLTTFDAISFQGIYVSVSNYTATKYKLDTLTSFNPDEFIRDEFVLFVLENTRVMNVFLENALIAVRRQLVKYFLENKKFDKAQLRFCLALVSQQYENEYVYPDTSEERECLSLIKEQLLELQKDKEWVPLASPLLLAVTLMFTSLVDLVVELKSLDRFRPDQWPAILLAFVERDLTNKKIEYELATGIASDIFDGSKVSKQVREQYEENPYPSWTFPRAINTYDFPDYIRQNLGRPNEFAETLKSPARVLVAGCGTGRQAVDIAIQLPSATVLAVDISLASLGYAQRKAKELGLVNLEFKHTDILQLEKLNQQFDLIACSGVLHHMENPQAGWQVLANILAPHGFMHILLYSAIARAGINQHRNYIKQLALAPTRDNIRNYRASIINAKKCGALVKYYDFWNTSECRDLLFHVQEHQFTWLDIQRALSELKLELLAVNTSPRELEIFKGLYPKTGSELDLNCWHQYEKARPDTFAAMLGFWCTKAK